MVYRAKVTKILSWIEKHYYLRDYPLICDEEKVWIEVNDPDEAYHLECMNELQEQINLMESQWREKFG